MPLDHTAFPTIIDRIITLCDRPTLLAFRATSQAYRCRISKTVFAHAALLQLGSSYSLVLPCQAGPRPIDFLPLVDVSISTIDLYLDGAPTPRVVKFVGQLGNLRTLRRFGRGREVPIAPNVRSDTTVVDYISFWKKEKIYLVPAAARHILHLNWDGAHTTTTFSFPAVRLPHTTLSEVVIVIHRRQSVSSTTFSPFTALYTLVEALAVRILAGMTVTVVGLERLDPRQISVTASHTLGDATAAEEAFKDVLLKHLKNSTNHPLRTSAQGVTDAVSCVTMTDWRRSLGERRDVEGGWVMPRTFQPSFNHRRPSFNPNPNLPSFIPPYLTLPAQTWCIIS
ncbi:uncharacterized protein LOC62_04G005325 [Vanrija pseudolonga]|uniref:Uncharacterized protein n=1 Tax=Vanrija pseudolonga TaxID=143232 RepID=A0AAF0YDH4_9TREE|nr:hypothetical protein LOC62_04G005325 [Vanrija pseudolonga]